MHRRQRWCKLRPHGANKIRQWSQNMEGSSKSRNLFFLKDERKYNFRDFLSESYMKMWNQAQARYGHIHEKLLVDPISLPPASRSWLRSVFRCSGAPSTLCGWRARAAACIRFQVYIRGGKAVKCRWAELDTHSAGHRLCQKARGWEAAPLLPIKHFALLE